MLIDRVGSNVRRASVWNALRQRLLTQYPSCFVKIVSLHKMEVCEQIKEFQLADIVVGVHGAGLANIIFCRPQKTKILEIVTINPPQVRHLFWHLATSVGVSMFHFTSCCRGTMQLFD